MKSAGEWSASRFDRFTQRKEPSITFTSSHPYAQYQPALLVRPSKIFIPIYNRDRQAEARMVKISYVELQATTRQYKL
jgi:hypothetical protein